LFSRIRRHPELPTDRCPRIRSLPGARQEAAALTRTFGHDAAVLLGPEASEAALKAANLAGVGLVYFAAHGEVDIEHPERSALLLSPGGGEDGRLRLREIAALRLDGAVVVLAACHSAEGRSFPAQGVFSMARAFLHAGASAVVGNVREVDDDSASLVMRELTAHLGRGAPVAEALAAAQRQAIADGLPPAAWASAVVIGDGRVHLEPAPTTTFSWLEILAAAALVTLAVAGLALQQRRLR
jgi:CHAT domain-containing protein